MSRIEEDTPISGVAEIDPTVETFSKLPRESLRALYYRLGGTDDISNLHTRCALLKKIYEAMGNDPADLNHMHRASSVLQKISEVASVGGNGGKYVGVDISDEPGMFPFPPMSHENDPVPLTSKATSEINAIVNAGKIPIVEAVLPDSLFYGVLSRMVPGVGGIGWRTTIIGFTGDIVTVYVQSSDYNLGQPLTPK